MCWDAELAARASAPTNLVASGDVLGTSMRFVIEQAWSGLELQRRRSVLPIATEDSVPSSVRPIRASTTASCEEIRSGTV